MCNNYRLLTDMAKAVVDLADARVEIRFPEGVPNIPARDDIKINDMAPIVRSVEGERGIGELVNRRWSWPAPNGKPVYNFRADGREFGANRCLILADGFYEFTAPLDVGQKRKTKWLFTLKEHEWFCVAGIWRALPDGGEAFTMLTMPPGEDLAPYHDRQIAILPGDRWSDWLDPGVSAKEILGALPKGSLAVERVYPPTTSVTLL